MSASTSKTNGSAPASNGDESNPPDLVYEDGSRASDNTDPTAWNLETPIPTDLDTEDEFPDIIFPLFDYRKINMQEDFPKPELRDKVIERLQGVDSKKGKSVAESNNQKLAPAKRPHPESEGQEKAGKGDESKEGISCEVKVERVDALRCALDLVGDAQCTLADSKLHIFTTDKDSPELTQVSLKEGVEIVKQGSFNISQKNSYSASKKLDGLEKVVLRAQGDAASSSQTKTSATLSLFNASDLNSALITCEGKIISPSAKTPTALDVFEKFQKDATEILGVSYASLVTSLMHLSQFGTHLDISVTNDAKSVLLSVSGAEWKLPVGSNEKSQMVTTKPADEIRITVKNLSLTRILSILRQAGRLCGTDTECKLSFPGILLSISSQKVDVRALVKEEKKKKGQ